MAKIIQIIFIGLLVSVCSASPARLEKLTPSKTKLKFLARQEALEGIPAQTPYPPSGIRPEVPFNLPTEEESVAPPAADIVTSGKVIAPADYYLPPIFEASKFSIPSEVYGPPSETYGPPAETYGPPEVSPKDENSQVDEQPDEPQLEETQQDDAPPEETQPDEVESTSPKPAEEELKVEAELEQPEISDEAQVEIAEEENNELLERIILAKKNSNKKAGKLQTLQPVSAQQFFLIEGKLYSVRT